MQWDDRDFWGWAASAAVAARPRVTELFGDGANSTLAAMDLFSEKLEAVLRYIGQRPLTLVHGDYHPKQLFFPSEAGGEFTVLDWQFSFAGQGAWDLARMMTMGQDVDNRRARERDLIGGYYQGLLDGGVKNNSMADLEDDIRIGLFLSQMINTSSVVKTDIAVAARECESLGLDWRDVALLRGEAAINDWDVLSLLSKL